ncbi:hypothetical protein ACPCAA_05500 [Streptomyces griseoincarnatus]
MPWPLRKPSATVAVGRLGPSAEQEDEGAEQDAATAQAESTHQAVAV